MKFLALLSLFVVAIFSQSYQSPFDGTYERLACTGSEGLCASFRQAFSLNATSVSGDISTFVLQNQAGFDEVVTANKLSGVISFRDPYLTCAGIMQPLAGPLTLMMYCHGKYPYEQEFILQTTFVCIGGSCLEF